MTSPQVIIFTDRSPELRHRYGSKLNSYRYNYSAGAHKIVSVLRQQGISALVVPNCLTLSFYTIQNLIEKHKDNLLWVGLSTSLLLTQSPYFDLYRKQWLDTKEKFVDPSILFETIYEIKSFSEMPWAEKEIWAISQYLEKLNIPFILGGAVTTEFLNGGLKRLHKNSYIVRGNAETWAIEYTKQKQQTNLAEPPYIISNSNYDEIDFKLSTIAWNSQDQITKDDWLPIEIARGCAFNCAYCTYDHKGKFDLFKNPDVIRNELIKNWQQFGVTKYMLVDDLYNDSKDKVRILYDQVWSKLPFTPEWTAYFRLDMFWSDPDSIEIIRDSGAVYGTLGIETLHDKAGRKVGKGLGKKRILATLEKLKKVWNNDVLFNSQFIAGLPDEPKEHILETMKWSATTDLIHSVSWTPLYISPPTGIRHNDSASRIGLNNDKYGITWQGRNWTNNVGLTFADVDHMVKNYYENKNQNYRVHFGNYSDLRVSGLTHTDIITVPQTPVELLPLDQLGNRLEKLVKDRLDAILTIE